MQNFSLSLQRLYSGIKSYKDHVGPKGFFSFLNLVVSRRMAFLVACLFGPGVSLLIREKIIYIVFPLYVISFLSESIISRVFMQAFFFLFNSCDGAPVGIVRGRAQAAVKAPCPGFRALIHWWIWTSQQVSTPLQRGEEGSRFRVTHG